MTILERRILDVMNAKHHPTRIDRTDKALEILAKYQDWMQKAATFIEVNRDALIQAGKWLDIIAFLDEADHMLSDLPSSIECPELHDYSGIKRIGAYR